MEVVVVVVVVGVVVGVVVAAACGGGRGPTETRMTTCGVLVATGAQ